MKKSLLALMSVLLLPVSLLGATGDEHHRHSRSNLTFNQTIGHALISSTEAHRPASVGDKTFPTAIDPARRRAAAVPAKAGDGTVMYGELTYSNSMNSNDPDAISWGLYTFPAQENTTFTRLTVHPSLCANGGGTYRKGKLYFTSYYEDFNGLLGYLYFCSMDIATYQIDRKAIVADSYGSIGVDMTYDPVGDIIYTVSFDPTDYNLATYQLATIDINTGYATAISRIDRMSAIACDNMGQLWAIRYSDGMLVKIDKLTGAVTEVGATGVNPIYNGSATFDFETGKLYWSTTERSNDSTGLYEINTVTGRADLISVYADDEAVSSLFIPRADDITTLSPVTNLQANFNGAATTGTISFTVPSTDKNGNTLTGDVNVMGYIDGMLTFSRSETPGASVNIDVTLEQGPHTLEIIATHPTGGRADKASLSFYVGYDGPAAVTDLTLTKIDDTHARLTWTAPAGGEHGGTVNPALVYYKVVRMPDGVVVDDEVTGNELTDVVTDTYLRTYSYRVTGIYRNIEGATAESNVVEFGKPCEIPYLQTFDTMDDYRTFVIKDNNPDPSTPGLGIWGWDQSRQCAMYKYHTLLPGDDYLITPGFHFDASSSYKLKFKAMTERYYPERFEILMGHANDVKSMTTTIMPATDVVTDLVFINYEFPINPDETGSYYIAFHAVSNRGNYRLWIDDVEITAGPSVAAPGVVTQFEAKPGPTAQSVIVTLTAPDVDFANEPLTSLDGVKIMRDGKLVGTITDNVAPGATLSFTDTDVPAGTVTYSAIAFNVNGDGNSVETSCYAGLDIPQAPTDVTHKTLNGTDAVITWTAPTVGKNGGSIAYEPVTYLVTDQDGNVIAQDITATTYTHTAIDTTNGQKNMYYFVHAVNGAGTSMGGGSDFITYGPAYSDGFAESFAGGKGMTTSDWMITIVSPSPYMNTFYGRYWGLTHLSTDRGPRPAPQDGDGGLLIAYTDYVNVESRMISPKINVKSFNNPVLSFYFYHYYNPDTENGFSHPAETMDVETYIDGRFTSLLAKPIMLIDGNGWYRYDILLKDAVGDKDFQIAFHAHNYLSYDMHIDNITVHDVLNHDLSLTEFSVPELVSVNSTRNIRVGVVNNGSVTADSYAVELYRDGLLVASQTADASLAFACEATFDFPVAPTIVEAGKTYSYSAKIVYAADENQADNTSETKSLTIPDSELPGVYGLKINTDGGKLTLMWNEPDESSTGEVTDGFESYEAFTTTNFGEWTLVDVDTSITYTITNGDSDTGDYDYPNAGSQMAFMAFNPGLAGIKGSLWNPYLGNQMAVCFAAAERDNDDWLISPQVKGGTKVSFMARSVVDTYGLEKFRFCYSATDNDVNSFVALGDAISVPAGEWTLYEFDLPEEASYFAINCISSDTYALFIDEVKYTSANPVILDLKGFNVYRDGVRINDNIVEESYFTDESASLDGTYTYHVTAVYDKGESALSEGLLYTLGGVEAITADALGITVNGHDLYIHNAGGRCVSIHTVSGACVFSDIVASDTRVTLNPGVYVVSTDSNHDNVHKIVIK